MEDSKYIGIRLIKVKQGISYQESNITRLLKRGNVIELNISSCGKLIEIVVKEHISMEGDRFIGQEFGSNLLSNLILIS